MTTRAGELAAEGFDGPAAGIYIMYMPPADRATTKLFQSNRSQAVRLPKAVEFPPEVREVAIRSVGRTRVIAPANAVWDDFFDAPGVDLGGREQAAVAEREAF